MTLTSKFFLIDGFCLGFRIGLSGTSNSLLAPSLRSAEEQPEVLYARLDKEWSAGRIVGAFSCLPFAYFVSSPLGVVPKKTPGKFRIIHHLSYPDGSWVNDFIPSEKSTVQYASISDAIAMIKSIGRGSYMSKTDLKSAFRIISIHPDDYHLLGIWNGIIPISFTDACLWVVLPHALFLKLSAPPCSGSLNIFWPRPASSTYWTISCLLPSQSPSAGRIWVNF